MRAYLAGKMTGLPSFGFPVFDAYQVRLEAQGWEILSPAQMDRALGFDGTGPLPDGWSLADCLRRDFAAIVTCDAVIVIPDQWESSEGVTKELRVADDCGIPILNADTLEPLVRYPTVVGLSGFARSGKDTAAAELVAHHGFVRLAFADALRVVLYDTDPRTRHLVDTLGWEAAKALVGGHVRERLQHLGVAVRRHVSETAWVDAILRQMQPGGRYVVTDCRFPNEAEAIRARGGRVIRIERPGTEAVNSHISERALDGFPFDAVVSNDSTPAELGQRLAGAAGLLERVTA